MATTPALRALKEQPMSPGRLLKPHVAKRHAGLLVEPPPPVELTTAPGFDKWSKLGAELAGLGPHWFTIAVHAARAAASGGTCLPSRAEKQTAAWFTSIVEVATRRGGGLAVAEVPCPGTPGFLASLRAAAARYVHTIVAGTSADDISELRSLLTTIDDGLEAYRPWGLVDAEDAPASEFLEPALANQTLRRPTSAEVCGGFSGWARVFIAVPLRRGAQRARATRSHRCHPPARSCARWRTARSCVRDRSAVLHGILSMLLGAVATNFHAWKAWDWLRMTAGPRHAGSLPTQRDGGRS